MGYKRNRDWYEEVEKYKKISDERGRYIIIVELNKNDWDLPTGNWFIKNSPESLNIKSYADFVVYCGYKNPLYNITKHDVIKIIYKIQEQINKPIMIKDLSKGGLDNNVIIKYWGNFNNMQRDLGLEITGTYHGGSYTQDELVEYIHKFYKEFNTLPTVTLLEKKPTGYPTRKSFEKYFGSMKKAIESAGYEYTGKNIKQRFVNPIHNNKDYLIKIIRDYVEKYDKIPSMKDLNKEHGRDWKNLYQKHFGSWNKCLIKLGLKLNQVSQYTDEELEFAFKDFIREYNRVPSISDFNKTDRPSFWCYQNRFGSWNNAVLYYGYETNDRNRKFYLDSGEICASGYEYDISNWLNQNNISYERNIKYIDFIDNYKGKMDCDYKFTLLNGDIWYVEMAGFLRSYDFKKLSEEERKYYFKLQYKKKLLRRQNCNYVIISVNDFKTKSFSEIFYFLDGNLNERQVC